MDDPMEKRRTIYDLAAAAPSMTDIWKFDTTQIAAEPQKKIRYSVSMVNISTLTAVYSIFEISSLISSLIELLY